MSHVTQINESRHPQVQETHNVIGNMNESLHTYERVMSYICMRHVIHMNASCHTYEWVTSHI